jgi:uncharacterized RDD family membrane protein YckC
MTNTPGFDRPTVSGGLLPSVALPPEALDGVRTRRMMAVCVDFVIVSLIVTLIWVIGGVLTLGLALVLLVAIPPLFPIVAFFYNGFASSGVKMGTIGMRMFDLAVRDPQTGGRVSFLNAALHGVLFYVSWLFPPVLLYSLAAPDKRCLHDIFSGVIVTRR